MARLDGRDVVNWYSLCYSLARPFISLRRRRGGVGGRSTQACDIDVRPSVHSHQPVQSHLRNLGHCEACLKMSLDKAQSAMRLCLRGCRPSPLAAVIRITPSLNEFKSLFPPFRRRMVTALHAYPQSYAHSVPNLRAFLQVLCAQSGTHLPRCKTNAMPVAMTAETEHFPALVTSAMNLLRACKGR